MSAKPGRRHPEHAAITGIMTISLTYAASSIFGRVTESVTQLITVERNNIRTRSGNMVRQTTLTAGGDLTAPAPDPPPAPHLSHPSTDMPPAGSPPPSDVSERPPPVPSSQPVSDDSSSQPSSDVRPFCPPSVPPLQSSLSSSMSSSYSSGVSAPQDSPLQSSLHSTQSTQDSS